MNMVPGAQVLSADCLLLFIIIGMLITHKQSLIMLSITCRCILYALVSVVVPWGCRSGMGAYEAGRGKKAQYTHYKKLDYTTAQEPYTCHTEEK